MVDHIPATLPLVSVIIPTHNRSADLTRALTSVKNQTYKNIEVIVIDDASTDDTESVVRRFTSSFKLVYCKNKENLLAARSRNIGLKVAKGEYLALLDDDDEFLEKKIEIQLNTALSLSSKTFILCNGNAIGKGFPYAYDTSKPSGFVRWKKNYFPVRCKLPPPSSWFFHREAVDRAGCFDETMVRWEDIDYCMRLMAAFPVYMINQCLVNWYTSSSSLTGLSMIEIEMRKYFLKKHFDWIRQDRNYLYSFYWRLGKDFKQLGRIADANEYFRKALLVKPYKLEALGQLIQLLQ